MLAAGACGGSEDSEVGEPLTSDATTTTTTTAAGPEARVIEVTVVGGAPQGGSRREVVRLNERVALRVTSDVADEVHVHGYDVSVEVTPGETAELAFDASIPGVFEVELEERHREIMKLEVRP